MRVLAKFLALTIAVILVACGGSGNDYIALAQNGSPLEVFDDAAFDEVLGVGDAGGFAVPAATSATFATPAPAAAFVPGTEQVAARALQFAQRQVISTASISIEVEDIQEAIDQLQAIAEGVGGFVEQLSSSGGPDSQRANVALRVPQDQFSSTLDSIDELGEVQNQNMGSEDVSERFIDLGARLKSSLKEEESLLSLLERAGIVSEVLAIERELFRVRTDIERSQGQLNFLQRRIELATIAVSLTSPQVNTSEPPSASLTISVSDVDRNVDAIKRLTSSLNGVVDRVFLSQRSGKEEAQLSLRVFRADFEEAVRSFEGRGKVTRKEVSEGTEPDDDTAAKGPDSRITLLLESERGSVSVGLIAAIAGPLGGIALAAILAVSFFWIYRSGRRLGRGY